jgi:hypothetical protein
MTHYVYRTVFATGEYYIGVRKLPKDNTPEADAYCGSGKLLKLRQKTLPYEKQVVASGLTHASAYLLERQLVSYETLADPLCLNLVLGGRGGYLETVPLCKRWQRDTEKLKSAVEKTARHRRGKTKTSDEGLRRMSLALSGRMKQSHSYLLEMASKLKGRTKATSPGLATMARKNSVFHAGKNKHNTEFRKRHSETISGKNNHSHATAAQRIKILASADLLHILNTVAIKKFPIDTQAAAIKMAISGKLRRDISTELKIPLSSLNALISRAMSFVAA